MARYLLDAARDRTEVEPITATRQLSVKKAYKVQEALVDAMGGRIIGAKLGLTSKAKQAQMNVDEPVFGWLTDAMLPAPRNLSGPRSSSTPGPSPRSCSAWPPTSPGRA